MSPICQTFVQNAWKKDLCSNCFKTEDEHGRKSGGYRCHAPPSGSGYDSSSSDGSAIQNSGGGRRKHPITSAILNRADSRAGERAMGDAGSPESQSGGTTTSSVITTPQSRYVGVGNSRIGYPRSYYGGVGGSPWKSRLGDASEASGLKSPSLIFRSDSSNTASGLRSPALIKGLSSSSSSTTSSNGHSNEHSSNSNLYSTKLSPVPLSKNNEAISGSSSSLSSSASSPPVMLPRTYFPSNNNERPSKFVNSSPEFQNSVEEKNLKNTELTNSVRHQFLFGESNHSASSLNNPRDLNADVIRRSNLSSSEYRSENTRGLRYNSQSISNSTDDFSNRPVRSRSADDILATPVTGAKAYDEGTVGYPSVQAVKRVECDISSSVGNVSFASRDYDDDNDDHNDHDNVQHHNDSGILSANVSSEGNHSSVHNISSSSSTDNTGHISSPINNLTRFSEEPQHKAREPRISNNGIRDLGSFQDTHQSSLGSTSEGGKTSSCVGSSSSTCSDSETSEATSVADSTESEDHGGGFYNIEGLGGDEDSDEEKEMTDDKNESSTDDAVGEDRAARMIDGSTDDAGAPSDESVDETESTLTEECDIRKTQPPGKKSSLSSKKTRSSVGGPTRNITFNSSDEVIGYGGDVDYSDGEEFDDEDDDDDESDSLASFEMTQREKLLKKLTLQNTDFNAENDNFGDDIVLQDDHYELIKKYELACEDYDIYDDMKSTYDATKCLRSNITPDRGSEKSDVKVKLRRSTPLVSVKPFISRSLSSNTESPKVNPVLPMKNGELIRTRSDGSPLDQEIVPLQGIKPKYVSKEEEIVEKDSDGAMFDYDKRRVTSFGSNADTDSKERMTSFGSETSPEKVTSFGSGISPEKVTSFGSEMTLGKVTSFGSETTPEKVTSFGSETPPEKVTSFGSETPPEKVTSSGSETSPRRVTSFASETTSEKVISYGSQMTPEKITSFGHENPKGKVPAIGVDASPKEKTTSIKNAGNNSLSNEKSSTSRRVSENIENVTRLDSTAGQVKKESPVSSSHVDNMSVQDNVKPVVKPVRQKKKSKCLSGSQPLVNKTSKVLPGTTKKDICQNGTETNTVTYSKQSTDPPKKSNGAFNNKVIKKEIIRTSAPENESDGSNRSMNTSAAAVKTTDVRVENVPSTNSNSAKIEPISQHSIEKPKQQVPSITKEGDIVHVTDRSGASRPFVNGEPLVSQVGSQVNPKVTSRVTKETKPAGISSPVITNSNAEISSPRILEKNHEISSPVEVKSSPCKRRSSFMASQLGITDPEDEESNPETVENTADIPLKLVDVDSAASSVQPIYTQQRNVINNANSPTSSPMLQNQSESENLSCAVIKKSARSKRGGGGLSSDKDVWSDTASNSTDNDETKSSSSSEIYRDASSQQGSSSSHRSSTSSLMTTFGTPVANGSTPPQPSFLHSEAARAVYETPSSSSATNECSTTGYTTSRDFLKEIKAPPDQPAPTAGIQKSGFYASSSCLKGLPGSSRPVQTPRPPSVSRQSSSDTNSSSASGVVGSPSSHVARNLSSTFAAMAAPDPSKVLPNVSVLAEEVVYDLPVTVAQSSSNSTTGSLHYSTSSLLTEDYVAAIILTSPANDKEKPTSEIYYEVDLNDDDHHYQVADAIGTNKVVEHSAPLADDEAKSRFEAKRSFISSNLNMNMLTPQCSQDVDEGLYEYSKPASNLPSNQPGQLQQDSDRQATPAEPTSSVTVNELLRFQQQRRVQDPSSKNLPPFQLPDILQGQAILPHSVGESPSHPQPDHYFPAGQDDAVASSRSAEVDSYSSFTDDFDEDDDDNDAVSLTDGQDAVEAVVMVDKQQALAIAVAEGILNSNAGLRRVGERSSSATPFFRNSVGPTNYDATGIRKHLVSTPSAFLTLRPNKKEKGRSRSCPRNADHVVVSTPLPQQLPPQQQKTSKFSFVKASFFRPTSPPPAPTQSPAGAATRGRDRSKKSSLSRFSLKKFLRIGSSSSTEAKDEVKDDEKRAKEALKQAEREAKKSKLNIIHPLDYNKTAVQVIARPEKTSPAYDYTNLHAYIPASKQPKEALPTQHQPPNKQTPTGTDMGTRSTTPTVRPSQEQGKDTASGGGSVGTTSPVRSPGPTAAELMYQQSKEKHLQQLAQQQQKQKQQHFSQQKQAQQQRHSVPESPVYNNTTSSINNSPAVTNTIANTINNTENLSISPPINNPPSNPTSATGSCLSSNSVARSVPTSPWGAVSPSSAPVFPGGAVSPSSEPNVARGPASPCSGTSSAFNFPGGVTSPTPLSGGGRSSSVPSVQPFTLSPVPPGSVAATVVPLRRNTSFTTGPEGRLERRASSAGDGASLARALCPQVLGFNSEGRPKPPPPPRKTSLEQRLQQQKEDVIYQVPVVREYNLVPLQENKQQQLQQQLLHNDLKQRIQSIMSEAGSSNVASGGNKPQSTAKPTSLESTTVVSGSGVSSSQPANANLKTLNPVSSLPGTSAVSGMNPAPPRPDVKKGGVSPARPGPPPVPASKPRLTGTSSSPANVLPPKRINKNPVGNGPTQHKLVRQNAMEDVIETSSQANHAVVVFPETQVENFRSSIGNSHRVSTSSTITDSKSVEIRGSLKPTAGISQTRKPPPTGSTCINGVATTSSTVPPNSYCPRTTASTTGRGLQRNPPNPSLSPSGGGNGGGGVSSPIRPKAPPVLPVRTCGGLPGGNMQPPPVPARDSVYANLGDVRAPFTPRKPGRASSLRDEDKKAAQQSLQEEGVVTSGQTTAQPGQLPHQDPLYDSPATITHEALTKLMNEVCSGSSLPSAAYALVARETRSWQDVALQGDAPPVKAGLRVFQCGSVRQTPVTVVITPEPTLEPHPLLGPSPLAVLKEARVGGTVWVLPRMVLRSLSQYRALLSDQLRTAPESSTAQRRTLALVLLQLVAAFKQLQARGIEEASLDLLLLADPETGPGAVPRLVVAAPAPACPFPLPASPSPLCQVAVAAAENLGATLSPEAAGPPSQAAAVFGATVAVLRQERAGSLTKAQCLLEAFTFGPSTLAQDDNNSISEDRLQRWLDAERTALLRRLSLPPAPCVGSRPVDNLRDAANSGSQGSARKTSFSSSPHDADGRTELLEDAEDGISDVFELEGADRKVYQRRVSLEEKFQLMFLVRTNARSLAQSLALIKN